MQTIGAFQAKTHFSNLLNQVEKGAYIIITRHGRPVAKLIPATGIDCASTEQVIQRIKQFSQSHKLGGLDWKKLRDEGRK